MPMPPTLLMLANSDTSWFFKTFCPRLCNHLCETYCAKILIFTDPHFGNILFIFHSKLHLFHRFLCSLLSLLFAEWPVSCYFSKDFLAILIGAFLSERLNANDMNTSDACQFRHYLLFRNMSSRIVPLYVFLSPEKILRPIAKCVSKCYDSN
jgi:hypothetical protein